MPTIRYHEFRPGRWVKLVDGKAVGPATAEEVAAWKRELAGQAEIWEDVLKHAAPTQTVAAAPEPAQIGQADRPLEPPAAAPPQAKPAAPPEPPMPPRILRTVEEIRAAKAAPPVEVTKPAPQSTQEMPAVPAAAEEELPAAQAATERPAATTEPLVEAELEIQPPQLTPETVPSPPVQVEAEPVELTARVDETAQPAVPAAATKPAAKRRRKPSKLAIEPLAQPAEAATSVHLEAEVEELLPEAATTPGQAEEAEPELNEEPAVEQEEGEVEGPEPELEEEPAAEEEELEAEEPEQGLEEEPTTQEEAALEEAADEWEDTLEEEPAEAETEAGSQEAAPTRVRRGRAAAHVGAAKRKAGPPSDEVKGPQYLWFVTAPADDLIGAVRAGLAKYLERFGQPAGAVLCHALDLPVLEEAALDVDVREGKGVPAHNFWVGPK